MKLFNINTSKMIPLVIAFMIPFSMLLAIGYEVYFNQLMLDSVIGLEKLRVLVNNKLQLPLAEIITFGTVVIPVIMIRKAVREGTHNAFIKTERNNSNTAEKTKDSLIEE